MTDSSKVYIAIHIWRGVLSELEVYDDWRGAQKKLDEWRKDESPDDTLQVLEKEVITG